MHLVDLSLSGARSCTRALGAVVLLLGLTSNADAGAPAGARFLGPAPAYATIRLDAALELVGEALGLARQRRMAGPMIDAMLGQLRKALGFDPLRASDYRRAGVDPDKALLLSIAAYDARELRAANGAKGAASPAFLHHRLVVAASDPAKLRALVSRLVVPLPPSGRGALERVFGDTPATDVLLAALRKQGVFAVARPDYRSVAAFRIQGKQLVADLLTAWRDLPRTITAPFARRIGAALALPRRPAIGRDAMSRHAFDDAAGASLLLRARALQGLGVLASERDAASVPQRGKGPAQYVASVRRCLAAWRKAGALTGDVVARLDLRPDSWHLRASWQLPAGAAAALRKATAAAGSTIDPTVFKDALAFGATRLSLGPLGAAFARPPFAGRGRDLGRLSRRCGMAAASTLITGGWLGLLGVAYNELGAEKDVGPMAADAGAVAAVLRRIERPNPYRTRPVAVVRLDLGRKGAAFARAKLSKLGPSKAMQVGGQTLEIYPGRAGKGAFALREQGGGRALLHVGTSAADLLWFAKRASAANNALPATILAFGHVDLPGVIAQVTQGSNPMAKQMADRLGRAGGNIALDGRVLQAELRVERKR